MWCLTPSTYLPVPEAGFSPTCCSDIELLALSKLKNIPEKFCWRGSLTEAYLDSLSGTTLPLSLLTIQTHEATLNGCEKGEGNSSSVAGSPDFVRTFQLPEKAQDLTERAAECGTTWPASLARYDPDTHSLKTAQHSLIEDLTGCCVILPRWGSMRNGVCSEQATAVPLTSGSESGFWPTPNAMLATSDVNFQCSGDGRTKPNKLGWAVAERWPTPTVCGNYNRKGLSATSGDGLATVIAQRTYPTATATAYKGWSPNHNRADTNDRLDYTVEREGYSHGQTTPPMRLNPDWTEWLMGWPIKWTSLKSLCKIDFILWEIANGSTDQTAGNKAMHNLWWGNDPAEVGEWKIRLNIQEQEILLHRMQQVVCTEIASNNSVCGEGESTENVHIKAMQNMRKRTLAEASCGRESYEQFERKYNVFVSKMPCCGACQRRNLGQGKAIDSDQMCNLWSVVPSEEDTGQIMQKSVVLQRNGENIRRTAVGLESRSHRLKAIGNGQVPICAAMAWSLLGGPTELYK